MPTMTRNPKPTAARMMNFRFSHRGVQDYSGLLQHYRKKFHLAQPLVVRLTGFSPRSVAKWAQGEPPSHKQEKALVEMDRLLDSLARVMETPQVVRWLCYKYDVAFITKSVQTIRVMSLNCKML